MPALEDEWDGDLSALLPFEYHRLESPRSFRLLQLRRKLWGGKNDHFSGKLLHQDLDRSPPFTALSYVWGDSSQRVPFECDGKILRVTQNCYDALERLISGRCRRLVWVDAISIDQGNIGEKGTQVGLMCDIYTRAQHVMIWLGRGSPAVDDGMQRLRRCSEVHYLATCKGPFRHFRMRAYMRYIEKGFDNRPGRYGTLPAGTIGELLSNEWFERLWVLQEAALPKADQVSLYCGSFRVRLDSVMNFATFALGRECKIDHWTFARAANHCAALSIINNIKIGDRGPDNLFRLLNIANQKRTSYGIDHVFAIHGIAIRNGLNPPMPDYKKSVSQVFVETARHCIDTEGKLTIVAMAGGSKDHSVPSWVPDFSLSTYQSQAGDCKATGSSKSAYTFDPSGLQLTVRGVLLETIGDCGPPIPLAQGILSHKFYTMKDTFARTLSNSIPSWIEMAKESYNRGSGEAMDQLRWTMSLEEPQQTGEEPAMFDLDDLLYGLQPGQELSEEAAGQLDFMVSMLAMRLSGRRFFLSESARMGLGPDRTEPGDYTALISGLRLPFVVRKKGAHFELIGWAFVYGIMHGQAWHEESELQDITFV